MKNPKMKKITKILGLIAIVLLVFTGTKTNAQSAACQVDLTSAWATTPDWTSFTTDTTVCTGETIDFNIALDNSYYWEVVTDYPGGMKSGGGDVSGTSNNVVFTTRSLITPGTYTASITLFGATCPRDTVIALTVLDPPVANVVSSDLAVCEGTYVTFTANGGTPGSSSYAWSVNGINAGTNNDSLVYTPADGDVINVTISNGACSDDDDTPVTETVYTNPNAIVAFDNINAGGGFCDGQTAVISETSLDPSTIASYSFNVGSTTLPGTNDSLETWTVGTGDNGSSAFIVVTDNNGCIDTSNVLTTTVHTLPDLTTVTPANTCGGDYMLLDLDGFTGDPSGTTFNVAVWDPTHTTQYTIVGAEDDLSNPVVLPTNDDVIIEVDIPYGTSNVHIQVTQPSTGCRNFETTP